MTVLAGSRLLNLGKDLGGKMKVCKVDESSSGMEWFVKVLLQ